MRETTTLLVIAGSSLSASAQSLQDPFPAEFSLQSLLPTGGGDGTLGWAIDGGLTLEEAGASVATIVDINGDGLDEALIGSIGSCDAGTIGRAHVVFGLGSGATPLVSIGSLSPDMGVRIPGIAPTFCPAVDRSKTSVAGLGDVNGDGVNDFGIGATLATYDGRQFSGVAFIVFGPQPGSSLPASIDLDALTLPQALPIYGAVEARAGYSISSVGDVNNDGIADIGITPNPLSEPRMSRGYVVFGRSDGFDLPIDLATLPSAAGFVVESAEMAGGAQLRLSRAGDINGDDLDDLLALVRFAPRNGHSGVGTAFVVFGKPGGLSGTIELDTLQGTDGFRIDGATGGPLSFGYQLGAADAALGDVNGDGLADLALGAPAASPGDRYQAGTTYVLFGRDTSSGASFPAAIAANDIPSLGGFRFDGTRPSSGGWADNVGTSLASGDVNGDGVADLIIGAQGAWRDDSYRGGEIYVVYGRSAASPFPSTLISADLDGQVDAAFVDAGFYAAAGVSVSTGDMNGDGVEDVLIGSRGDAMLTPFAAGRTFVVFGRQPAPCVADFDEDGALTIFDFLAFQNAFDAGDLAADCTEDGALDLFDFLCFQNAFDAGCE